MLRSVLLSLVLSCLTTPLAAQVLKVPQSFPTISAALAGAPAGATVLVEGGIHRETITWPSVDGIRLVGVDNPVIDGGGNGRVITVGPGLTRATLIQGFTIRGGLASDGAGLLLRSPITVRDNTITGCEGNSVSLNRGGGISIATGVSPRIERNRIIGNTLRIGGTNKGAGIFVGGTSVAEIVGNEIRANRCAGTGASYGAGLHLETPSASPLVVNNLIVQNVNQDTTFASGGGVFAAGGLVRVNGNTIADNTCTSGGRASGAGMQFGALGTNGGWLQNNIIVRNECIASSTGGGGIDCNSVNVVLSHNDVWQNKPNDYAGCTPPPTDLSVDPQFISTSDYRLQGASPLVDVGLASAVSRLGAIDVDGTPRRVDGNLDGTAGNGAAVDIGGDEYSGASLTASGALGQIAQFRVNGPALSSYALAISGGRGNILLQPFGNLLLAAPITVIGAGTVPATTLLPVPRVPVLEGVDVFAQALVYRVAGRTVVGQFSERRRITLATPFSRPIVEAFTSARQFDTGDALWAAGAKGLAAGIGFGGNGVDGDLVVTGAVTLDADTQPPGLIAEWNFRNLLVTSGGKLTLTGKRPIRLFVRGTCTIDGIIDASGQNGQNAPSGSAGTVGPIPGGVGGPGAGQGGPANVNPFRPIGALPSDLRGYPGYPAVNQVCNEFNRSGNRLITVIEPNCGGGTGGNRGMPAGTTLRSGCSGNGGGHEGDGFQTDFACANIGAFGREFGRRWVIASGPTGVTTLTSGTGGGAGGNAAINAANPVPSNDITAGSGGGGGGGLEISCTGTITVRGSILSNGGSGGSGHSVVINNTTISGGYGGGGSGGSVWLSGQSVIIASTATISALGGIGNPTPQFPARSGDGGPGYIIARDLSGGPTIGAGATVTPAAVPSRLQLSTTGRSRVTSKWYSATIAQPTWAFNASNPSTGVVIPGSDLVFSVAPVGVQQVKISFQGAPDLNGRPDPNPATWVPSTGFATNIAQLGNVRHIRYRIEFDLGVIQGPTIPTRPVIDQLFLRY